jgi:hypothetical protein
MHAPQPDNLDYRRKQQAAAHSSQNARIMKSERDNKRIDLIDANPVMRIAHNIHVIDSDI